MVKIQSSETPEPEYRKRSVSGIGLFVQESAMEAMITAADDDFLDDRETLGLMVGRRFRDEEGQYVTVDRAITSELIADSVSVEFNKENMIELIDALDAMGEGECVVGWYHSHLGLGCYMSEVDVRTQHSLFGNGLGFAAVIDPSKGEFAVFDNSEIPEKVQMIIRE